MADTRYYLFQSGYWLNGNLDTHTFVGEVTATDPVTAVLRSPVKLETGCIVIGAQTCAQTGCVYLSHWCELIARTDPDQLRDVVAFLATRLKPKL